MEKITSLTVDQAALLPKFRDEWLSWGICTERAERKKAETAICALRARIDQTASPVFIWCASPATSLLSIRFIKSLEFKKWREAVPASLGDSLEASLKASLSASFDDSIWANLKASLSASLWESLSASFWESFGESLGASLWDSLWDSLRASLVDSLRASLVDSLGASLRTGISDAWWGQHDSYWVAFYLFCRDVLGVTYEPQYSTNLNLWRNIVQSCCWWWCYENYVIISDRPTVCRLDDRGVLHAENGPALAFGDGWAVHSWHGTRVPADWIERKETLTPALALGEANVERRRAACEILGWDRILRELWAITIHKDPDPMIGELLEVNLPGSGKERFLRVLCATNRVFAIPVPPTVQTALEANAWTYGVKPEQYKPEVRT